MPHKHTSKLEVGDVVNIYGGDPVTIHRLEYTTRQVSTNGRPAIDTPHVEVNDGQYIWPLDMSVSIRE